MDEEAVIAAVRAALRSQAPEQAQGLRVVQLYELYKKARKTDKSWPTIETRLRGPLKAMGGRQVTSLKLHDWTEYRTAREQEEIPTGKPGRCYSKWTVNLDLVHLKVLLNWGVRQGLISYNPLVSAQRVKVKKHRETAPRERDIEAILSEASLHQRVVILCAVDAGMRRLEIRSLSWDWIDRDAMTIELPDWACKGGRGGRVPMTRRLLAAIDAVPRTLRSPYVLVSPRQAGDRYTLRHITRWWRDAADAAGVQAAPGEGRVRLHDGRRAFATNAVRRGVRIDVVSQVLRHASLDQTRDYVQSANTSDLDAARERFEAGIERDRNR